MLRSCNLMWLFFLWFFIFQQNPLNLVYMKSKKTSLWRKHYTFPLNFYWTSQQYRLEHFQPLLHTNLLLSFCHTYLPFVSGFILVELKTSLSSRTKETFATTYKLLVDLCLWFTGFDESSHKRFRWFGKTTLLATHVSSTTEPTCS